MNSLEQELLNTQLLLESGAKLQTRIDDDGIARADIFIPEAQGFYAAGEAPTMQELGVTGDPKKVAGAGAATVGGMVGGAFSGLMGIVPDLIALGAGPNTQEAADKMQAAYGTEAWRQTFFDFVDTLDVPEPYKFLAKDAAMVGEVTGLPGAAAAVKGAPKVAGAIGDAVSDYAAGAPARVAERQGSVTLGMGVDPMPMIDDAIVALSKKTPPVGEDELVNILKIKAEQMDLDPADRIQPSGQNPLFDTTPAGYQKTILEQKETPVPRAPEGKKLPLNNRAAILVEKADAITDQMAENIRPHLNDPVRYFYHTGPLIDKAAELGVPEDVAREQLKKFALNYAATSPRKPTEDNLRAASIVSAKQSRGIDYRDIVGPGTGGVSERGYPMMVAPGGIHAKLIDAVRAEGISYDTNPKPATFADNVAGNLQGVTADTHAIRGVLDSLNKAEPGSIPKEWFGDSKEAQERLYAEYIKNPQDLKPVQENLPGSLKSQKIDGVDKQTEYAVISDLYKMTAEKLGITPAEAQALHWFTQGERTGLVSDPKTIVDIIEERIDVTAQATGKSKENVFLDFFSGKMPLLSLGGGAAAGSTLLEAGATMDDEGEVM